MIPSLLAAAIGAIVFLQFAMWTALAVRRWRFDQKQFQLNQRLLRQKLELAAAAEKSEDDRRWNGFRRFLVKDLQREAKDCVTLDLIPEDGRPLPYYLPGQHIAIRLSIAGQNRPVVRCYSLSDAPASDRFRITVRAIGTVQKPSDAIAGLASNYLHRQIKIGDSIDVKAPTGSFYLDLNDRRPAVLLAAGIGITPMIAMLSALAQNKIQRQILLIYGVRDSEHHAFKKTLARLAMTCPNIKVVTCYSKPWPTDKPKVDFQLAGRITIDTIRKLVPSNQIPFYICGPSPFMQSLFADLIAWGVAESNIHFEAFGPASVRQTKAIDSEAASGRTRPESKVSFLKSDKLARTTSADQSILDLAEAVDVSIPSGCRAGNCGTCQTRLVAGQVAYINDASHADCEPGHVLACVARPLGEVAVDA